MPSRSSCGRAIRWTVGAVSCTGWRPYAEARTKCSDERALEHALEAGLLVGWPRDRLVEPQLDVAPVDLQRRHLIVEPGAVVERAPVDGGVLHAGGARQRAGQRVGGAGGGGLDRAALAAVERVAQRRADRLIDRALHSRAAPEAGLAQVGVVDIAG